MWEPNTIKYRKRHLADALAMVSALLFEKDVLSTRCKFCLVKSKRKSGVTSNFYLLHNRLRCQLCRINRIDHVSWSEFSQQKWGTNQIAERSLPPSALRPSILSSSPVLGFFFSFNHFSVCFFFAERFNETIFNAYTTYILNICEVCGSSQCPYCPIFNIASYIHSPFTWTFFVTIFVAVFHNMRFQVWGFTIK